jgi:hypothetical protein
LGHFNDLGLTLAEGKLLLRVSSKKSLPSKKAHAVRRPDCRSCGLVCRVKDYRNHLVATLSARSQFGFPDFAMLDVAQAKLAMASHRIAARRQAWIGSRRISLP